MKKLIILIILLLLAGCNSDQNMNQPEEYVVFASNINLDDELRSSLIKRLGANNIPYQIDENGNVKIPENKLKKAVICCS